MDLPIILTNNPRFRTLLIAAYDLGYKMFDGYTAVRNLGSYGVFV